MRGWWVRIMRSGKRYSQYFSDEKYGGKDKAKAAAIRFRNAFLLQFTESSGAECSRTGHRKISRRNKTGVEGVHRSTYPYRKRGKKYICDAFVAHWPSLTGKQQEVAHFSIKKYGEAEALRRAVAARQDGLRKLAPAHRAFLAPTNKNIRIWRYMDFTKFTAMLEDKALFFSRIDTLNDPFEGSFSRANEELRPLVYKSNPTLPIEVSKLIKELRQWVVVNCWHVSEYESAAMWELYSRSNEAICIQSTWEKLHSAVGHQAKVGFVQYVDYEKEWVPEHDPLLPFLYKRRSFEHEKEIRAIKNTGETLSFNGDHLDGTPPDDGILIKVDLTLLIETICVSPKAPNWFFALTQKIINKFGISRPVKQSSLMADPFY